MKKFWEWFKSLFTKAVASFVDLIQEAFPLAKQVIMAQLSSFGEQVVAELAAGGLSNEEKRNEAFKRIGENAKTIGISISSSLIYALIEILYQKYKVAKEGE